MKTKIRLLLIFIFINGLFPLSVFSIVRVEKTVFQNDTLKLIHGVGNTRECGVNIIKSPIHSMFSKITIDDNLMEVTYNYKPQNNYIGLDTVVLLRGCYVNGDAGKIVADTIEYSIHVLASVTSVPTIETVSINFFPNPIENHLRVEFNEFSRMNKYQLRLSSISSVVLWTTEITQQSFDIDMSTYPPGVYFIQLFDNENSLVINKKIIKK